MSIKSTQRVTAVTAHQVLPVGHITFMKQRIKQWTISFPCKSISTPRIITFLSIHQLWRYQGIEYYQSVWWLSRHMQINELFFRVTEVISPHLLSSLFWPWNRLYWRRDWAANKSKWSANQETWSWNCIWLQSSCVDLYCGPTLASNIPIKSD